MLYPKPNNLRWLLLAPLAFSALTVQSAQAKNKDDRTPPDFLLNRKYKPGVSLFEVAKVRGDWENARYATVNGYPYKRSLVAKPKTGDNATFTVALNKKYDRFQAWVGTREGGTRDDINTFRIVGDGQEIYKSPEVSGLDGAVRVDISVHDVSSLQLIVEGKGMARGVIAEPRLVESDTKVVPASEVATPGAGELVEVARPEGAPVAVQVGGKTLDFGETAPLVRGKRVMVPMRQLFDQIGAKLDFDPNTHEITATRGGHRIDLTVGSTAARVDGKLVYLDVPVQTLRAAMVYDSLKPTNAGATPTSAMIAPAPTGGAATSALPDLNAPNSAASLTAPTPLITQKDTDTTVSPGTVVKSDEDSGPIMVPLRFVAEAFNLPVGFQDF